MGILVFFPHDTFILSCGFFYVYTKMSNLVWVAQFNIVPIYFYLLPPKRPLGAVVIPLFGDIDLVGIVTLGAVCLVLD